MMHILLYDAQPWNQARLNGYMSMMCYAVRVHAALLSCSARTPASCCALHANVHNKMHSARAQVGRRGRADLRALFCRVLRARAGGGAGRPDDQRQRALRGHVVALPQATPGEWRRKFPCAIEQVPDTFRVVLVGPAATDDDVRRLASRARALQVRGWRRRAPTPAAAACI
jgi:hypothetical protein